MNQITQGKTKQIERIAPKICIVRSFNSVTAGNGERHDVIVGKATLANLTTCRVFQYLRNNNVLPLAYEKMIDEESFMAKYCAMIPLEVVGRVRADGSLCKRNSSYEKGSHLLHPIVEFFYKTTEKKVGTTTIECDDPLLRFDLDGVTRLYHPSTNLCVLNDLSRAVDPLIVATLHHLEPQLTKMTTRLAYALEYAWKKVGGDLTDFKAEYGFGPDGEILLADVIDLDSLRATYKGRQVSKQPYRDGCSTEEMLRIYELGEELTRKFLHLQWQE